MSVEHVTIEQAYARTEAITKDQARNFYYGIRLLSKEKRLALCAVYALARRIDDIGDGSLPAVDKLAALDALRGRLELLEVGDPRAGADDPVLTALSDVGKRFPLPVSAFSELIDGVGMDVSGRRYATFDELVDYCRCVAGTIGRLCLSIFGSRSIEADQRREAERLADILGIALQQTNILRDVREDLINGRVYLPQEDLDKFGVVLQLDDQQHLIDTDGRLSELVQYSAARARGWYDDGLRLVPMLDRRSAASCSAMAGIYRSLSARIEADPRQILDKRMSLSGREKLGVAARSLIGGTA